MSADAVHPGDSAVITLPGVSPHNVHWSVVHSPFASLIQLERLSDGSARLSGGDGLYFPGHYVFEASNGGTSVPVRCSLQVIPTEGLFVSLAWGTEHDLDLHIIRKDPEGRFCDTGDGAGTVVVPTEFLIDPTCDDNDVNACHRSNCQPRFMGEREWDGAPGRSSGDPVVENDALAWGPDVTSISAPLPGDYLLAVKRLSPGTANTTTSARVQVYVEGSLHAQFTVMPLAGNNMVAVAMLRWPMPGGEVCLTEAITGEVSCAPAECGNPPCGSCSSNADCGPGTECNTSLARCQGQRLRPCVEDAECSGDRCVSAMAECRLDRCTNSCVSSLPFTCEAATRSCVLLPARCSESDEPNNTSETAVPLLPDTSGFHVATGTLCRGDMDILAFDAPEPGALMLELLPGGGLTDTMDVLGVLSQDGEEVSRSSFFGRDLNGLVKPGRVEIALKYSVTSDAPDLQAFGARARFVPLAACGAPAVEPDDTTMGATPLEPGIRVAGSLCAPTDMVDHLQFILPAGKRAFVEVSRLTGPGSDVDISDETGTILDSMQARSDSMPVLVAAEEATMERPMFVGIHATSEFYVGAYEVMLRVEDAPPCPDLQEPNNTPQAARPLAAPTLSTSLCGRFDSDFFVFTTNAAARMVITCETQTTVDFDLYLSRVGGVSVTSATGSTSPEVATVNALPAGTYRLEVRPYTRRLSAFPAAYTLHVDSAALVTGSGSSSGSSSASGTGSSSLP